MSWQNPHSGWEFPDQAGYPDGTGTLDQGRRELVDEVAASGRLGERNFSRSLLNLRFDNDAERSKYDAYFGDEVVGTLFYRVLQKGQRVALLSVVVDHAQRGKGVATDLIGHVLDDVREQGRSITVICPVVREFLDRYPKYDDLIDAHHPGVASTKQALVAAEIEASPDDVLAAFEEGLDRDGRYVA